MANLILRGNAARIPLPDRSVGLVIGSPPYIDARKYLEVGKDLGIARKCAAWVEWMLGITTEALRVSDGLVIWVVAGTTRGHNYQPGPEGLVWEWFKRGGECHAYRPVYWTRMGIPGSGGKFWYRADVEYCLCFKRPGSPGYAHPEVNGAPPKFAPGGAMSNRTANGDRVARGKARKKMVEDGFGRKMGTKGEANGRIQNYIPPEMTNHGNLLSVMTGGGHMGNPLAHESEAPYPVKVPEFFIASHAPPGLPVLDPFSGSATTGEAAANLGRDYIGMDLRQSQGELGRRRLAGVAPILPGLFS